MGSRTGMIVAAVCWWCCLVFSREAAAADPSFGDNFEITGAEDHVKTSADGQTWYLYLDNKTGVGFQTKQRYLFGWFSMNLKLAGNDSAGVVTAYYMCSDVDAAPERDELDFEFLGNRTGEPYIIQTNVYRSGVGGREMRHSLWVDPTADFHSYSILWNPKQIVFFVDKVPIREYRNSDKPNTFFPIMKPMYVFSSIWNADDWATRGGLEKTDWTKAPFISSYRDFTADACSWGAARPARGLRLGGAEPRHLRLLQRPRAIPLAVGGVRAPDNQLVRPPAHRRHAAAAVHRRSMMCGQDRIGPPIVRLRFLLDRIGHRVTL
uniref:GH16 domain-containing protein n=1 Tax=Oryza brachyantha TaxID=4533 RepID=J3MLI8_ORYBR